MSEKIRGSRSGKRVGFSPAQPLGFPVREILDAVTDKVLSYRPVDKGLAAKKTKRRLSQKCIQKSDKPGAVRDDG